MRSFGQTHIAVLLITVAFYAVTMFAAYKLPRKGQTAMFILGALGCSLGLFWRYGLNMTLDFTHIRWDTLAIQMLQVCNFNFVLVLLMLIPKCELARQYSCMFSMFAAATVMLSIPKRYADSAWYDPEFLNFWLNHVFAIALPLWMMSAGRLKPQKKYILPVAACVVAYFLVCYYCTEWLHDIGKISQNTTFSYVYDPSGIPPLVWLHELIPVPCFYLAPLIPPMIGFFWWLTYLFRNSNAAYIQKKKK